MKKSLAIYALFIVTLGAPIMAQGQGFLFGLMAGSALGNSEREMGTLSSARADILYMLPNVSERVRNPMAVRLASLDYDFSSPDVNHCDIGCLFSNVAMRADEKKKHWIILQVARAPHPRNTTAAIIWFAFTESENVSPPEKTHIEEKK